MKNFLKGRLLAGVFALSSCGEKADPNMPSPYINVAPPEWAQSFQMDIWRFNATVTNENGKSFNVERNGTDLGGGLTARRDFFDLYIFPGLL